MISYNRKKMSDRTDPGADMMVLDPYKYATSPYPSPENQKKSWATPTMSYNGHTI